MPTPGRALLLPEWASFRTTHVHGAYVLVGLFVPGLGLTRALLWLSAATRAVAIIVIACYMGGGRGRWLGIKPTAQVHKHPGGGVPISPISLLQSYSNGPRVVLILLMGRLSLPINHPTSPLH